MSLTNIFGFCYFFVCQQMILNHIRSREGGGGAYLRESSISLLSSLFRKKEGRNMSRDHFCFILVALTRRQFWPTPSCDVTRSPCLSGAPGGRGSGGVAHGGQGAGVCPLTTSKSSTLNGAAYAVVLVVSHKAS